MAVKDEVIARVSRLPARQLHALLDILEPTVDDAALGTTSDLPGLPRIDPDELSEALTRNRARLWQVRDTLYRDGLSRDEAAARLGVGPNQVTNLLADGKLLALDGEDGLRLPAWQFDPNARRGRLDGIDRVAAAFPGRILGLSAWMVAPNPSLGGRAPSDALLDGDAELVAAVAAAVAA